MKKALPTNMTDPITRISCVLIAAGLTACAQTAPSMQEDPAVQALLANDAYDAELCTTAQRMLLRAEANDYETITLYAEDTFVVEQMNANREDNTVTVASLTSSVKAGSATVPVTIACKMINQDRGRFILQLKLETPRATCRDVNELTYAIALEQIGEENRRRYLKSGTPLKFVADYPAAAGGEWLPSVISDFITPVIGIMTVLFCFGQTRFFCTFSSISVISSR